MLSPEEVAELLIHPVPTSPEKTAILIPSTLSPMLLRPPLMIHFEALKTCSEAQATLIDSLSEIVSGEEDISTIYGSSKERCGEFIKGISQKLGISGQVLIQTRQSEGQVNEETIYTPPNPSLDPRCALFVGMIIDREFTTHCIEYLRKNGLDPVLMVSIVNLKSVEAEELLRDLGLTYRYLVESRTIMERPGWEHLMDVARRRVRPTRRKNPS